MMKPEPDTSRLGCSLPRAVARRSAVLGTKKVSGVPDLLVEILSPSSGKRDRTLKRDRYERAGVREYWLVDREARVVQQFVLRGGNYREPIVCSERLVAACSAASSST